MLPPTERDADSTRGAEDGPALPGSAGHPTRIVRRHPDQYAIAIRVEWISVAPEPESAA